MSPSRVIGMNELRRSFGAVSFGVPFAAFFAVVSWFFCTRCFGGELGAQPLPAIWGGAAAPGVPFLCAVATMRAFAGDRATGAFDLMMSTPVRERDWVMGKFMAALTVVLLSLAATAVVPLVVLPHFAPEVESNASALMYVGAFSALALQAMTWCAAGIWISAGFRNVAAAGACSALLCGALPYAACRAAMAWSPALRSVLDGYPPAVHVMRFSTGLFSTGTIALYVFPSVFFLFAASKTLAMLRTR